MRVGGSRREERRKRKRRRAMCNHVTVVFVLEDFH